MQSDVHEVNPMRKATQCGAYLPVSRIVEKVALLEEGCREVGSGYLPFG